MVRQGDFIVELVEANTKTPFKEHSHDGKTFVEVEPGQEYFIAVQKPGSKSFSGMLLTTYFVDGQYLGSRSCYAAWKKYENFRYKGCWEKTANSQTATVTALKFVPPEIREDATSAGADEAAVGKTEVKVFQGINPRPCAPKEHKPVNISSEVSGKVDESAKPVRSTNGECKLTSSVSTTSYDYGALLSTIVLYYCTTPGLISMGVIAGVAPNALVHNIKVKKENERKRKASEAAAAAPNTTTKADDDSVVSVSPPGKVIWTVDMTGIDDSDSD